MRQGLKDITTLIVMGPAGSGKSTLGRALATHLGWDFVDADDLHDARAKAKMAAGIALSDTDRQPWLQAVRDAIAAHRRSGCPLVCACSALTRDYRRLLAQGDTDIQLVFLDGPAELLAARLRQRPQHFFAPQLLRSQLQLLEPPSSDEALILDIRRTPQQLVDETQHRLNVKKGP
jgi:gluconokinase